jgi:malonyl-CoA decarboxylase
MKSLWLERVIDSVADRGRELLRLRGANKSAVSIEKLCRALLSEKGEASGTALARELVTHYQGMTHGERLAFFELLNTGFGPDEDAIIHAADEFRASREVDSYLALRKAIEPARNKLFRRINIAPNGIAAIVAMRTDLLDALEQHPQLKAVDADLRRLLASWFNRGFLRLHRIDWRTSATILEKLITYESVHEIQSWDDLRRRLAADRRCFAFFHPALPEEPLIFVEAALVKGMSSTIAPLLDEKTAILDPAEADSVVFYSINNCLRGLRGISFGNFLIKQVVTDLAREFPAIKRFSTLSPMPSFTRVLQDSEVFSQARLAALLGEGAGSICHAAGEKDIAKALALVLSDPMSHKDIIARPLTRLGLACLVCAKKGDRPYDPVAFFHLSNGARLERINAFANVSDRGLQESAGLMVNYRYIPEDFEANHEAFVHRQEISLSRKLQKKMKSIRELW